jgi:hypothetical protein
MSNRPTLITLFSIFWGLGAILFFFAGIGFLALGTILGTQLGDMLPPPIATILLMIGGISGMVCLGIGAFQAVLSWGLWKAKPWARTIMMVLAGLDLMFSLLFCTGTLPGVVIEVVDATWIMMSLISVGLPLGILWYMFRKTTKAYFGIRR